MNSLINEIAAKNLVLGTLSKEAEECHERALYIAAISCLILLTEETLKFGLDGAGSSFFELIKEAEERGIIFEWDFRDLNSFGEIRNKLFDKSYYAYFLPIEGVFYSLCEPETRKIIYETYSDKCFKIVLNILLNKKL